MKNPITSIAGNLKYSKSVFTFAILFFGLFGLAESSWAATYYVRTDGNNNCNGSADAAGSSGNCAYRTVQKGIDTAMSPGDIVNISGDHSSERTVYFYGLSETVTHGCTGSGCATNPTYITIQRTPGTAPDSALIYAGIRLKHNYIKVKDLAFVQSGGQGNSKQISMTGNYGQVLNAHLFNPVEIGGNSAVVFGGSHNLLEGALIEGSVYRSGGHQSGSSGTTLTDSYNTWTTGQLVGKQVFNMTTGIDCGTITSNDTHSFTTSGSCTWTNTDCYAIGSSYWIPIVLGGQNNTVKDSVIRNLINSERVFDGLSDGSTIQGTEVYDLLDSNENRSDYKDNCGAHTDLFQIVGGNSYNVTIKNNYFHDLQSQTGMIEGTNNHDWTVFNNIFANITHRNTIFSSPNNKIYNNTFFNVAQGSNFYPIEGWIAGVEYKNNIIIGGDSNPNYGIIGGLMGDWQECAKNVINRTWSANADIFNWLGQGGTQVIITANSSIYIASSTTGTTGSIQPDWVADCPNVGDTCSDNGVVWTNTAWNTTCVVSGMKDVIFGDQWGLNRRNNVTSSFTCNSAAVDGGDPRQYDVEGIKYCKIKDSSDVSVSNNYYGIWNPPTYGARTASIINNSTGDKNYVNGGDPGFVAAYTDCINNSCDFRLRSDSPLRGAGVILTEVMTDKNGVSRPNPPAIGAYEYVSGAPADTTPPAAPSGLSVS